MFAKTWNVGDLVWAKMRGFPYWPGKIVEPPSKKKAEHYVYFFGSKNYGWVMNDYIVPHSETMIDNCKKKGLKSAVNEIIEAARASSQGKTKPDIPSVDEDLSIIAASIPKNKDEKVKKKKSPVKREIKESTPKKSHSFKKMKLSQNMSPTFPSSSDPTRIAIIRPFDDPPSLNSSPTAGTSAELIGSSEIKYERPTDKRIGFLGLGSVIGRCMVKNLLKSGHCVIVYDSNPSKTEDFEKAGASVKSSPASVVEAADIIFSCITDSETAKDIVLRPNSGVLEGLRETQGTAKGFVEMWSIDEETTKGIAQAVKSKGGRYLEAPIIGGIKLADQGLLTIVSSGDKTLFNDCETCFHAIARHVYYLGPEHGKGVQLSVMLNTLTGSVTAVMAEALALARSMKVSQMDLLETLKNGGFLSPFLFEKGKAIIKQNLSADSLLKHQHDAVTAALEMGEEVNQPLNVISAVNELYKHARFLGYSDHDMAAVYKGAIF